jgi:3-oxoacyl-[acyl-carrier protein] reductase
MQIKNKTIVITGGGRGLGRAMAVEFARKGGQIALVDLDEVALAQTQKAVEELGSVARTYVCDVANEAAVIAVMGRISEDFVGLDVLINNAGIVRDSLLIKVKDDQVVSKMSLAQWEAVIAINLTGVFLCGREAAERMINSRRGGVIVNMSSLARKGNIGQTNYSAAKAGVAAMTTTWAKELARYGIRVGAIAPGYSATDILMRMTPETLARVTAPVPLKRLGEPVEIAATAVFIVENDFITGCTLPVDGGLRL